MKRNLDSSITYDKQSSASVELSLDAIDKKMLNILQENNQITNIELTEKVNLSAPPCFRRVI